MRQYLSLPLKSLKRSRIDASEGAASVSADLSGTVRRALKKGTLRVIHD